MGPVRGPTRPYRDRSLKTRQQRNRATAIDRNSSRAEALEKFLRKEVIQPQVPLRLPCYDFTPVTSHTMDGYAPCGFDRRLPVQLTPMV